MAVEDDVVAENALVELDDEVIMPYIGPGAFFDMDTIGMKAGQNGGSIGGPPLPIITGLTGSDTGVEGVGESTRSSAADPLAVVFLLLVLPSLLSGECLFLPDWENGCEVLSRGFQDTIPPPDGDLEGNTFPKPSPSKGVLPKGGTTTIVGDNT